MIKVWSQTDKIYSSNGDIVLRPLKAKVTKNDNGDYLLDLETTLEYIDYITEGRIVTANTPTGDQAFRIGNVTRTKYKIVSKCYHVFYDSENYLIADSLVENRNCDFAIKHLNNATEPQSEFTVSSDITRLNSFRCVRKSLYEAINTIIEKWGGHIVRDNFDIQIKDSIGVDNGIIIQYKKNIKDISCQENWNNVVTKLLPVGKDGLLLNKLDPSASIYLVSSNQYTLPYCKTVSFSQDIDRKDYPSDEAYFTALVNDLRAQGTKYLEKYSVPDVSYTLKANLDKVSDIGDIIEVIDERLNLHLMTSVTGFVYDCLSEQYTEVSFGNFQNTINGLVGNLTNMINNSMTIQVQGITAETNTKIAGVETEIQNVADAFSEILNDSYVTYDGEKMKIFDSLPSDEAEHILRFSNDGIKRSANGGITWLQLLTMNGEVNLNNLTLKNNNQTLTDFILSEGVTGIWLWRKYTSGMVEAWTQIQSDSADLTWTALETLQTSAVDVSFPFEINNAVMFANIEDCPDVGWTASAKADDENGGSVKVVREGNTGLFTINIMVKGELE